MKRKHAAIIAVLVAVMFITTGIILGQNIDVLNKAVRICLECIGIG